MSKILNFIFYKTKKINQNLINLLNLFKLIYNLKITNVQTLNESK